MRTRSAKGFTVGWRLASRYAPKKERLLPFRPGTPRLAEAGVAPGHEQLGHDLGDRQRSEAAFPLARPTARAFGRPDREHPTEEERLSHRMGFYDELGAKSEEDAPDEGEGR